MLLHVFFQFSITQWEKHNDLCFEQNYIKYQIHHALIQIKLTFFVSLVQAVSLLRPPTVVKDTNMVYVVLN